MERLLTGQERAKKPYSTRKSRESGTLEHSLQARGRRFDPGWLHSVRENPTVTYGCRGFLCRAPKDPTVPGTVPKEGEKRGSARQRLQGLEPLAQRLAVVLNAVFDHVRAVANLTEVAVDPLYHRGAAVSEFLC